MNQALIPCTIAEFIFKDLKKRIIEGDLKPGQTLIEEVISARHGSSRGPIRESLRLLLQTGLVEHQPRRGFKVRKYSPDQIKQIYHLRANLEGLVILELKNNNLNLLEGTLDLSISRMEDCFRKTDLVNYFQENIFFHQQIIDFAKNDILKKTLALVNEVSLPVRYQMIERSLPSRRSLNYHEKIVERIKENDFIGAKIVTEKHILENATPATQVYA